MVSASPIRFRGFLCLLMVSLFFVFPSQKCFGWGGEHADQARVVLELLPELRDTLSGEHKQAIVKKWCFYPDDTGPFMEEDIGKEAVAYLNAKGFKKRHNLHYGAIPHMCKLLSDAFREKNPAHVAVWIGALAHVIGDSAANNHDPLFHVLIYHCSNKGTKVKTGSGEPARGIVSRIGMRNALKDPAARRILDELAKSYRPQILGVNSSEITRKAMLIPYRSTTEMTEVSGRIAGAMQSELFEGKKTGTAPVDVKDGLKGYAELLAIGARNTADVVNSVAILSKTAAFEVNEQDMKLGESDIDAYLKEKPLSADAIFDGLLRPDETNPLFGVVIEPTYEMNRSCLGLSSKFLAACIMAELKEKGLAYRSLDLRRVCENGFPSPREVPTLIVVAYDYTGFRWIERKDMDGKFGEYLSGGGRVLWLGGQRPPFLGGLTAALNEEKEYPGFKKESFNAASIIVAPELNTGDPRELPFVNPPVTAAGWQKPWSYCVLKPDGKVKTLIELKTAEGRIPAGGMIMDGSGKVQHVFLPLYAVFPQILDRRLESIKPVRLDPVARKILLGTLELFREKAR